jgi:hypothetical protein
MRILQGAAMGLLSPAAPAKDIRKARRGKVCARLRALDPGLLTE